MENQEEKKVEFPASAMSEIMAKVLTGSQEDQKGLRRRGCYVIIYPDQCMPGYITAPVKVGITELNSSEELRAYRASGGIQTAQDGDSDGESQAEVSISQQALACAFGKESLSTLNGYRMTREEKRALWEILGMGGRIVIGTAYMTHCTGADSKDFTEKSLSKVEIF